MFGFITKLLGGNKSEKDVRTIEPIVEQILEEYEKLSTLSNDELRAKTIDFKERIQAHITEIDTEITDLKTEAESDDVSFDEKEELYKKIDGLEKDRDDKLEEILNELLPEAFAVMKETARRFTENETLTVTATDLDRDLAAKKDFITIDNDKAIYNNTCLLYTSPSPRDRTRSRMPSSA